jgi:hypothetical protein
MLSYSRWKHFATKRSLATFFYTNKRMEQIMAVDSRRRFLKTALVASGALAGMFASVKFNAADGIKIGESKVKLGMAEAQAMCGAAINCSGGGGQCGAAINCSGGGGRCGAAINCGGQ